jgi:2,4-dienoyl-CoA reductase-like NADH-dependent reductase (Old Yellow Enzyme family)
LAILLEKSWIGPLELNNRAIRSATWEGAADPCGFVTDRTVEIYDRLARGGIGLIVSGFQYVKANGIAMPHQIGNYCDSQVESLTRITETVDLHGTKILAQLVHCGAKADPGLFPEDGDLWGASAIPDPFTGRTPREMTTGEITDLVESYASAAKRAQRAGFDGVQLHAAHGYGINQFFSPSSNRRGDRYGGSIGNRFRLLGEIVEAIRSETGGDFPLFVKLSGNDFYEDGLTPDDSRQIGIRLADTGVVCIEVSGGSKASVNGMFPSRTGILREEDEAYLAGLAGYFKGSVRIPVATVGGIRSPGVVEKILNNGYADYVSLSRPFIREPHLIKRWESGDLARATCISCNGCYETGLKGLGISCKVENRLREDQEG